jgi:hypothetical protein
MVFFICFCLSDVLVCSVLQRTHSWQVTQQRSEESAVQLRKQKHVMMFQTQLQILGFAAVQEQLWTDLDLQLDVFR